MQTAHDQEVLGSNPGTVYWIYVSDASIHKNNEDKDSLIGAHQKNI